ncbi:MAG: hypothetical protein KGJ06_07815, partial [Pseudomonadota bacterium]|nr:hypothetical protein [Pseudomonadota bacterium]
MRKVLLISLSVCLAVMAAGYVIVWYTQAAQVRHGIEKAIASLNAKQTYLTYDAIETSGFPSSLYVSLVRPHFNGRIDTLLKNAGMAASLPEWTEDALLSGRIVLGINALSDHYSLRLSGNWQHNGKIGEQSFTMAEETSGDTVCTLEIQRHNGFFSSPWNFQALTADGKTFFNDIRLLDCQTPGNTVVDAATHEKLMSGGPARFYISSAPQGELENIRVYGQSTDAEITTSGEKVIAAYAQALAPGQPYSGHFSAYGKQNLEIDFAYAGPSDWKKFGSNPPLDINLSKLNVANQLYNSNITFYLSNATKDNARSARLAFRLLADFSEQYDALMPDLLRGFIQQLYTGRNAQLPNIQPITQKYTPEQLYSILSPAVPNFHSLGRLTEAFDATYQGAPDLSAGDVNLSGLEFSTASYGITASGNGRQAQGNPMPEAHVTVLCSNCLRLVDDVLGYTARMDKAMASLNSQPASPAITDPRLADGVKNFLKALAGPAKGVGN